MTYENNVYGSPEKFGLTMVGSIEWDDDDYQFDLTAVWKNSTGGYYLASDSGCSCPSPFEDLNSVSDLFGPYTKNAVQFHLEKHVEGAARSKPVLLKEIRDLLDRM